MITLSQKQVNLIAKWIDREIEHFDLSKELFESQIALVEHEMKTEFDKADKLRIYYAVLLIRLDVIKNAKH